MLVVLLLVGAAIGLPALSSLRALSRAEARASALVWESGAVAGQLHALWSGSAVDVWTNGQGVEIRSPGVSGACVVWEPGVGLPSTNVARWRDGDGVVVRFLPGFGAPDAGGSLFFGAQGIGDRVVVRVESGLTRRARW